MKETLFFSFAVWVLLMCGVLVYFFGQSTVMDSCDKYGAFKTDTRAYTCQRIAP